jgi:hypothetical protein
MSSQWLSSMFGLYTRAASIPLLFIISTAIATTKIPELLRVQQGSWYIWSAMHAPILLCFVRSYSDMGWRRKLVY